MASAKEFVSKSVSKKKIGMGQRDIDTNRRRYPSPVDPLDVSSSL